MRSNAGEDHRRMLRKKESERKKKRRRTAAAALLTLGLIFGGYQIMKLFSADQSPQLEENKPPVTGDLTEHTADPVPVFQKEESERSLDLRDVVPKKPLPPVLKEGRNHNQQAEVYAYDTAEVKDWIKGRQPYSGEKIAFFTFDDGPVGNTYKVLDILKKKGVPGTFFIPGVALRDHKDKAVLNRYIEEGHAIAVHSFSHDYGYLYPGRAARPDRIKEEFLKTRDLMRETLGDSFDTKVFRFPGGSGSWKNIAAAQEALKGIGVTDIDWNSLSGDSEPASRRPTTPEGMVEYAMDTLSDQKVQDVAVVLMHDFKGVTAEYLEILIDRFVAEGYTFGILK